MSGSSRTVAVLGAGVVGQVYAGRLAAAGHGTWLLARGATHDRLRDRGVRLALDGETTTPPVTVVASAADIPPVDVAYLAVRADQVQDAMPALAEIRAETVVTLVNLAGDAEAVARQIGPDRVVLGFSGIGGTRSDDNITYHQIDQQATTLGKAGGREQPVADDLREAGFKVDVVQDAVSWLATHAVFIAGVGAAIVSAGSSEAVGDDRERTTRMVLSVRDGFRALERRGISVTPTPLRIIFTRVPRPIAVRYWRKQLRGALGRLALAPHVLSTRDTEFALLAQQARELTAPAPALDSALTDAGFPAVRDHPGNQP